MRKLSSSSTLAFAGTAAAKEVSSSGAKVVFLQLDTSKPESIQAAAAEVAKSYNQQIDLLVSLRF